MFFSISAKRWACAAVFFAAALAPRAALACAMCFASSSGPVLHAFYMTAVGLTLLPVLLFVAIAAGIGYFRRRSAAAATITAARGAGVPETRTPDAAV